MNNRATTAAGDRTQPEVGGAFYWRVAPKTYALAEVRHTEIHYDLQNPFSGEAGDIVYKTGDMGRLLEDGEIELLGRRDEQVKIRGVRIELAEVENSLRAAPGVREVAVIDREDREGTKYLCAYIVGDEEVDFGSLRAGLATQLPESMIPSAFVLMEKLPRTISGKLDRRSLPSPGQALAEQKGQYLAPRTPVEEMLADIWAEVLGLKRVGINDNFFELGGHSLLATQVMSRVRATLGVELPLRVLFETPTLASMAPLITPRQDQLKEIPLITHIQSEEEQMLANLDQLSQEDVEALLSGMLAETNVSE